MSTLRDPNPDERGQTLIVFAFVLAALIGITGLVIDVGGMFVERRHLQNAADAAALAGAAYLPDNPDLAASKARDWATRNGIDSGEIQSVQVLTTKAFNDTIRIDLGRPREWGLGKVLGLSSTTITSGAAAIIGSPTAMSHLSPWVVTNSTLIGLKPGDIVTLKYDAQNPVTGNFLPVAIDGTGSAVYQRTIQNGSTNKLCVIGQEQAGCPSTVSTEPGNMVGPTRSGLQWLSQNVSTSCDTFSEVFTSDASDPGRYEMTSSCNPWLIPQPTNIAIVPVIDSLCNGSCNTTVLRFAMIFLEGYQCSGSGGGNSCTVTGQYVEAAVDVNSMIAAYDPLGSIHFVRLIE